jgi:1-acyl-sn-glycerol-3-phosphate acyltransferase
MSNEEMRARCQALTQAGEPCKNYALDGSDYCRVHAGSAGEEPVEERAQQEEGPAEELAQQEGGADLSDEEVREQLLTELDELTERVQATSPEYQPPPFSPKRFVALVEELIKKLPVDVQVDVLGKLRDALNRDLLDMELIKGAWYMINHTVEYNADVVKRRFTGEYDVDEWGLDWEFLDAVLPFFNFLYKIYWRVDAAGLENIPQEGRALLVANHSGQLPWDSMMVGTAVLTEHPSQRLVRTLYGSVVPTLPYLSAWATRLGQALASVENGVRLLEQEELVAVFPEGYKGTGKPFRDRYNLARFGRGGFVKMALDTGAPIIPVSVIGAEETNIALAKLPIGSSTSSIPYLPITTTFPWLGLLGFWPLPTKWFIDFGEPITMDTYGPDASLNLVLVSQLTDHVRNAVQDMVNERLAQRRSIFF